MHTSFVVLSDATGPWLIPLACIAVLRAFAAFFLPY